MTLRNLPALARAGAVTLLTAGLVAVGAPAYAADQADLALVPVSTQLARGVTEAKAKPFVFTVDNTRGTVDARDVTVSVDARKVDRKKVGFVVPEGCQRQRVAVWSCVLGDLAAGTSENFVIPLFSKTTRGDAGTLSVTVGSETADPERDDNSVDVDLTVTRPGYDLVTWAQDVYADVEVDGAADETGLMPVRPGQTAPLDWAVYNGGSRRATGVFYGVTLPVGVSFAELPATCVRQDLDGAAQAFCEDRAVVLKPGQYYTDTIRVKVAEDVTEPVLRVGNIFAYGLSQAAAGQPLEQPRAADATQRRTFTEVDPGDNSAVFDVFVDLSAGPGPSPTPTGEPTVSPGPSSSPSPGTGGDGGDGGDGGVGGGDGDDGGLPVTGVQAGLIGGIGGAVLLAGGVMFLVSRRRRVLLVTPDDERPTA
ncbi:LPXTG cell wall anchor domain-containing protein [Micromonospora sp. WMMD882]|uniref:LPXTG cell wall anchor domain-containing protein n=1 Tax=Micromonospora sp. WMMD882 TaxID=3015151 RepID=UPI00248BB2B4|nr:LPXTG cell wall anchor domain-containing protein [Micromonospora sp. WMMD882]WBB77967.1 LPXTG cell wall anchor domain-containing protein [Micromonospora sp. WMMD882]